MKATIKAGIGGYPFNFEEDAYNEMSNYISSLNDHFSKNEEGKEIVSDLEVRIAELLQLRVEGTNKVISLDDVKAIIKIMGTPKDIDSEDENGESINKEHKEDLNSSRKKRLFRNGDNSILGGVCSGFAAYFNIDTVLIRIGYVLAFILSGFILPDKTRGFLVVAYIILWIVMPKAKTFNQKLSMVGAPPSVDTIENRNEIRQNKAKGSGLLNFIKIFFGVILGLVSLSIIITLVAGIAAYWGFYGGYDFPGINAFIEILGLNSFNFNVSMIISFCLPLIAILYLCIKLLFRSQFKAKDAVIFALGFITWIGAGCYLGGMTGKIIANHKEQKSISINVPVTSNSDTLYIGLSDKYKSGVFLSHTTPSMMYLKGRKGSPSIALYPKIRIQEDSSLNTFKIEIVKIAMDANKDLAYKKAKNAKLNYILNDSLLTIEPHIYNKKNKWDREMFEIKISKPKNKLVICDDGL